MSSLQSAAITAVQGWLPPDKLTNADLEKLVDTNDEWIRTRTGISERRILKDPTKATSDICNISSNETSDSLFKKLASLGREALLHAVETIAETGLVAKPQPESGVTYAHKILKAEAKIDWSMNSTIICQHIRAFVPEVNPRGIARLRRANISHTNTSESACFPRSRICGPRLR